MDLDIFFRIKHWQLFCYLFFLPLVMIIHNLFFYEYENLHIHVLIEIALINIYMVVFGIWFFALGRRLDLEYIWNRVTKFLKANLFVLITYTVIMNYFVVGHFLKPQAELTLGDNLFFESLIPIIITAQTYSTLLFILTLLLFSKGIVSKERKITVRFNDYIGLAFLFLVSPIGVWYIQPRVNDLYRNRRK